MLSQLTPREQQILELLIDDTLLSVAEISKKLGVSQVTIRSDFQNLEEKGFLVRTDKKLFPAFHPVIMDRMRDRIEEKKRVAKYAASLVENGDTIMIEAGTTTSMVARYLVGKRDVHIVTNSSLVLPYGRIHPSLKIVLLGGEFRPLTESFVGPVTLKELSNFHVRLAFVGTDGFSIEKGLTTHLVEGAEVVRKMSEQAAQTILLADSSKYGKIGFVKVLPLDQMDIVITDKDIDPAAGAGIEKLSIQLHLV